MQRPSFENCIRCSTGLESESLSYWQAIPPAASMSENTRENFHLDVAGVALIESSSPRQIDELPGFRASYDEDKRDARRELWKDRLRVCSGWERLLGHCHVSAQDFAGWAGQYNAMGVPA